MADVSVRPASPDDAPAVAAVQAASWKETFAGTLPPAVLDMLRGAQAVEQWRLAAAEPPSRRHHLLVAQAGSDVVGFAALAPASDPDTHAETDAELSPSASCPTASERDMGRGWSTPPSTISAGTGSPRRGSG